MDYNEKQKLETPVITDPNEISYISRVAQRSIGEGTVGGFRPKKKSQSRNSESHIASKMSIHTARAKQIEGAVYMTS